MNNIEDTVLSQYANSPIMMAIINKFNKNIDPSIDIDTFYNNVFNLETAIGFGLDILGRIIGVSRLVSVPTKGIFFGFYGNGEPFGQAPFSDPQQTSTKTVLSDRAFRSLIMLKALSNISSSDIPSLNAIMNQFFTGRGNVYVLDLLTMKIRYVFEFVLEEYEKTIISQSDILHRPAGVQVDVLYQPSSTFGFSGNGQPFGQAPFLDSSNHYQL